MASLIQARALRQHVWINELDCREQTFDLRTEIQVLPVQNDVTHLRFHLGQCTSSFIA